MSSQKVRQNRVRAGDTAPPDARGQRRDQPVAMVAGINSNGWRPRAQLVPGDEWTELAMFASRGPSSAGRSSRWRGSWRRVAVRASSCLVGVQVTDKVPPEGPLSPPTFTVRRSVA